MLDSYVRAAPSAQAVFDIFAGEWSSRLPDATGLTANPAGAMLFSDQRIAWAAAQLGGFEGRSVLELGPLEGGHTYMVHEAGAASILSIEANRRAFLKCLCVKEVFNLERARFLLGDFVEHLRATTTRFDVALVCGVLYHMRDPLELLRLVSTVSDRLCIWTHYYEATRIAAHPGLSPVFHPPITVERHGMTATMARKDYGEAVRWRGYCGGSADNAFWMTRESLFGALETLGFARIDVEFDQLDHPNGPALMLVAQR